MNNSGNKDRIDLGFDNLDTDFEIAALDEPIDQWKLKPKPATASVAVAAAQSGFRSREPATALELVAPVPVRRRRTGRNAQINIKAKPETIERLYSISDRTGLSIVDLFEKAVAILEMQRSL